MEEKSFFPFYEERIERAIREIQNSVIKGEPLSVSIWEEIKEGLYGVFHSAAIRTLIGEIHWCKERGMLGGDTAEDRYDSFCVLLKNAEYREQIYIRYPELSLYLDVLEENQIAAWIEFIKRLETDWEELQKRFELGPDAYVRSIRLCGSDFHQKGKAVIRVETATGEVFYYKPHSIGNEHFLQDCLKVIYEAQGMDALPLRILERENYGWVKEIPYQRCRNQEEVIRFCKRMGILAAVSYVLGVGDLHYENIVAYGEYPMIVDAETMMDNMGELFQWTGKTEEFYSVLSSGLFLGGAAVRNIAGVTGGEVGTHEKKVPVVLYDKTSDIQIGYRKPMVKEQHNRLFLNEEKIVISVYKTEILDGFIRTYEWFMEHKNEVSGRFWEGKAVLTSRFLSGNTQFFSMALSAASHPKLMREKGGRNRYLCRICEGRKLAKWEVAAMEDGDVPWFYRKLDDRHLYTGQGIIFRDFFDSTVIESLKDRLGQLSKEDCNLQQKVLEMSLEVFCTGSAEWDNSNCGEPQAEVDVVFGWKDCVKQIADEIVRKGIRQKDKLFWLGLEGEGQNVKIRPVDFYFYSGIAGIAVFFRKFYQECGLYQKICVVLEDMLFSYTNRIKAGAIFPATEYPGMYCGESSIVHAYQLLYKMTGRKKYRDYAGEHARILCRQSSENVSCDLLYGNAGAVLVLCQQYEDTGESFFLDEAIHRLAIIDKNRIESDKGISWFENAEGNPVCSLAHGNSGILLAYARVNGLKPCETWRKRIWRIMEYEDQFYDEVSGNWADLRKEKEPYGTYAWCNGGMGGAFARILANKWNHSEFMDDGVRGRITNLVRHVSLRKGMCLCHGNLGNLLMMREMADFLKKYDEAFAVALRKMECGIIGGLENSYEKMLVQERNASGLMNGASGIGLGLLLLFGDGEMLF